MSNTPKRETLDRMPELDRRKLLQILGPTAAIGVAGCLGNGDTEELGNGDDGDTTPDEIQEGGTLNVGMSVGIQSLDGRNVTGTQSMQVAYNIYSRLLEYRPGQDGEDPYLEGNLAVDWEREEDTILVMDLHEDATFHNGNPVTADDVVHTFETTFEDPEHTASTLLAEEFEVSAIDEKTVEFDTGEEPFTSLESTFGFILGIVNKEADEEGDMALEPVGSGPFEFEEWTDGSHVYVNSFDDYWKTDEEGNSLPYLDRIEFNIFPDDDTKFQELESGGIDWIDNIPPRQVEGARNSNDIVTESAGPGGIVQVISFNTVDEPFSDPNYRKAVLYTIDWEAITEVVYQGLAEPAGNQLLAPQSGWQLDGVDDPYVDVDIDRAQELIDESDIDPEDVSFTNPVTRGNQEQEQIQQIIQQDLSEHLGIEFDIEREDRSTQFERVANLDFGIEVGGIQGMWDPDQLISVIFNPEPQGFFNYGDYENDEIISLLGEGRHAVDEDERRDIYRQIYEINNDEAGKYFPLFLEFVVGHTPEVHNFTHLHDQFWLLENVWMEGGDI